MRAQLYLLRKQLLMAFALIMTIVMWDTYVMAGESVGVKIMGLAEVIVPLLWAASGPAVTVMITSFFNNVAKSYVPRWVQVPLAAMIGAVSTGLLGIEVPQEVGAAVGLSGQIALSADNKAWLASARLT